MCTEFFVGMWTSISASTLYIFKMGCEKGIKITLKTGVCLLSALIVYAMMIIPLF